MLAETDASYISGDCHWKLEFRYCCVFKMLMLKFKDVATAQETFCDGITGLKLVPPKSASECL